MNRYLCNLLSICFGIITLSCSEGENEVTCMPENVHFGPDSISYEYNASRHLTAILYYSGSQLQTRDAIKYSADGKLIQLTKSHIWPDHEQISETHKLLYANDGNPLTLNSWNGPTTTDQPFVTTFTHDSQGRLLTREPALIPGVTSSYRYEYDSKGNVTKLFFRNYGSEDEVLGQEYTAFDNHERFFNGSDDLKTINIYIYKYEPSKNNVTSATIKYSSPGSYYGEPQLVNYVFTYNDRGLVTSRHTDNFLAGLGQFFNINYGCK
jgi:hypothetical protein